MDDMIQIIHKGEASFPIDKLSDWRAFPTKFCKVGEPNTRLVRNGPTMTHMLIPFGS